MANRKAATKVVATPAPTKEGLMAAAAALGMKVVPVATVTPKTVSLGEVQAQINLQQSLLDGFLKGTKKSQADPKVRAEFGRALRNAAQGNYNRGRNIHEKGYDIQS